MPEWNVYAVIRPFTAHPFQHLEELAEMQGLAGVGRIDQLVEVVGLLPINRRRQVPREIDTGIMSGLDDGRRHVIFIQHDDEGALTLHGKPPGLQFVYHGSDLVVEETLSCIFRKRDIQQFVDPLEVLDRLVSEPVP